MEKPTLLKKTDDMIVIAAVPPTAKRLAVYLHEGNSVEFVRYSESLNVRAEIRVGRSLLTGNSKRSHRNNGGYIVWEESNSMESAWHKSQASPSTSNGHHERNNCRVSLIECPC